MSANWKLGLLTLALLSSPLVALGQESTSPSAARARDPLAVIRSLLTDPEFKNFAAPAENAWDFNAADGVPGFGPIEAKDEDEHRSPLPQTAQR